MVSRNLRLRDGVPNNKNKDAPLRSQWLDESVGRDFLGGRGVFEVWESLIADAVKEGRILADARVWQGALCVVGKVSASRDGTI